jgi:hypothetical protein
MSLEERIIEIICFTIVFWGMLILGYYLGRSFEKIESKKEKYN